MFYIISIQLAIILLVNVITNNKKILLLVLLFLNIAILTSTPSTSILEISSIIQHFSKFIIIIKIIMILFLIYSIFQILLIFGLDKYIDKIYSKLSPRGKKIFIIILSLFSTNVNLSDFKLINNETKYLSSLSIIVPTLNIFSITNINLFSILFFIDIINPNNLSYFLLFIINIPVILFIIKNIIDLFFINDIEYIPYEEINIRDNLTNKSFPLSNLNLNNSFHLKKYTLLLNVVLSLFVGIIYFVIFSSSVLNLTIIFLVTLLLLLFLNIIVKINKSNHVNEINIYRYIFSSRNFMINIFLLITITLLVTVTNIQIYSNFILIDKSYNLLFFLLLLLSSILFTYLFKSYSLSLSIFIPLITLYYDKNIINIVMITSIIFFTYFLTMIHLKYDKNLWFEIITIYALSLISFTLIIYFGNLYYAMILLIIYLLIYYIFNKIKLKNYIRDIENV